MTTALEVTPAPTLKKPTVSELVSEGVEIRGRMAVDKKRLDEIQAELVKMGAGRYESALVIQPAAGVKPEETDIPEAKKICGKAFKSLFTRNVSHSPVKNFASVAAAVLSPGKCKKLLALVSKEAKAYVKWS